MTPLSLHNLSSRLKKTLHIMNAMKALFLFLSLSFFFFAVSKELIPNVYIISNQHPFYVR